MADEWFYAQQGRQLGPVGLEALLAMIRDRRVSPTDLVWRQGMVNWIEARTAPELNAVAAPLPLLNAPQHQQPMREMQYLNPAGLDYAYAGFWLRFVACFIDSLVLMIPTRALSFAAMQAFSFPVFRPRGASPVNLLALAGFGGIGPIIIWWLYYALMESSAYRATLGKMALGLIVTDETGQRLTFGRATGRTFGKYISGMFTIYIGYCMAGFTQRKQGLHDIIARTLVVRKDVARPPGQF